MDILKRFQLLLTLFVMLAPDTLQAQEKTILKNNWGSLNASLVYGEDDLDLSWGINYNFGHRLLYQVGFKHFTDFTLVGPSEVRASYLNVSRGLATSGRYHNVAVFGGPAIGLGTKRRNNFSDDQLDSYAVIGLHTNVQVVVMPFRYLGVGLELHGTINTAGQFFTGIGFMLQIGGKRPLSDFND